MNAMKADTIVQAPSSAPTQKVALSATAQMATKVMVKSARISTNVLLLAVAVKVLRASTQPVDSPAPAPPDLPETALTAGM